MMYVKKIISKLKHKFLLWKIKLKYSHNILLYAPTRKGEGVAKDIVLCDKVQKANKGVVK